ncbi:hypothetical protein D3C76_1572820 [compost metagenome]
MGAFSTDQNAPLPGTIGDLFGQLRGRHFALAIRDKFYPEKKPLPAHIADCLVALLQFTEAVEQIVANGQCVEFQVIALDHIEYREPYRT